MADVKQSDFGRRLNADLDDETVDLLIDFIFKLPTQLSNDEATTLQQLVGNYVFMDTLMLIIQRSCEEDDILSQQLACMLLGHLLTSFPNKTALAMGRKNCVVFLTLLLPDITDVIVKSLMLTVLSQMKGVNTGFICTMGDDINIDIDNSVNSRLTPIKTVENRDRMFSNRTRLGIVDEGDNNIEVQIMQSVGCCLIS